MQKIIVQIYWYVLKNLQNVVATSQMEMCCRKPRTYNMIPLTKL